MDKMNQWIEIDGQAVRENLRAIRTRLKPDVILMAVIKENAYGHGMVETAQLLTREGVDHFAVTWLHEALTLREAGIEGTILLLAPVMNETEIASAIRQQITLCAASERDARLICETAERLQSPASVHIKIETGLSRFGLQQPVELEAAAAQFLRCSYVTVEGAFTHMADASDAAFTAQQYRKFQAALEILRKAGINPPCLHCANSGVFLKYPEMHLNMVRLGTLLCGQYPAGNFPHPFPLKDPYHYKTRIVAVRTLPAGSFLGYKRTWRLKKTARIAVIPVGYSDGLALQVQNRPQGFVDLCKKALKLFLGYFGMARFQQQVRINGQLYPIRGKVFMQMALIELPEAADIAPETEVEVFISKTLAGADVKRVIVENTPAEA